MATAQAIIDATQARYKDPGKTQWGDSELLGYINAAIDYIHKLLIGNRSEMALKYPDIAITTTAGTEAYGLPPDFWAIYEGERSERTGVHLVNGTGFAWLSECSPGDSVEMTGASTGQPSRYYITADKIGLLPVPDAAYTIRPRYYFQSPAVALAGSMPWNGLFNEAIKSFTSSRALARNGMVVAGELEIYNELERQAMAIIVKREGRRPKIKVRRG